MHAAIPQRGSVMRAFAFGLVLSLGSLSGMAAQAKDVTVFAAASLKNALDDVAAAWTRETGKKTVISYAASNVLAKQIEAGAPADVFFSADLDWMDYVASKNLIDPKSRVHLLANSLVLVAPKDSNVQVSLQPGVDLAVILGSGRLAMGNVDAVPAGKYGKAGLKHLRAWDGVKDKVAQADNVRAALLLVSRGEAPLGIVYKTDAVSDSNVKVVASFPEESHPPIVYPVALTKDATSADATEFLAFMRSVKAKPFFEGQGFGFTDKPGSAS
ncbi:molybdate ABC transporter substrate-binding protein [Microvirga sp. P5_D2]